MNETPEDFLYRYKNVSAVETKTMVQKNIKEHVKDLNAVKDEFFKSDNEITINIISSDKKEVAFNKYILILFSKTMRSCLATFSCCSIPTILLPDCSAESIIKVHDILERQFIKAGVKSFKDIHTVVETAQALGINVDDLEFGPSSSGYKRHTVVDIDLSEEEDEVDDTIQEINSLGTILDKYKTTKLEMPKSQNDEYAVSSDDEDSDDDDDKQSADGSSSDGEVEEDENEAKTVSESVAADKKLYNETLNQDNDDDSDDDQTKYDDNQDNNGDHSDEDDINKETSIINDDSLILNFTIDKLKEYVQVSTAAPKQKLDQVLNFHNDLLETERPKKTIDDEEDDDGKDEPSPLKDEINIDVQKKGHTKEVTNMYPTQGSDFENRFRCTICHNVMRKFAVSTMKEHYSTTHFTKEIFDTYIKNQAETVCRVDGCGKDFGEKNRNNLVRHIGSTHNKAVEILRLKGLEVPLVFRETTHPLKRKRSEGKLEKRIKTEDGVMAGTPDKYQNLKYECEICGKYYSSNSNLERHLENMH